MGEAWVITSGKGGVGKSTSAANLALALGSLHKSVILVDADTGLRTLDIMLGLENRVVYDLCDVAEGVCRLKQALIADRDREEIKLIAAAQTRESGTITPAQMEKIVRQLKEMADFVLIDSPAGVGRGFRAAASAADEGIIVLTPDVVALRDAERVMGLLDQQGIERSMLLINRALPEHQMVTAPVSIDSIVSTLELRALGVIPEEPAMYRANSLGRPAVLSRTPAGLAYIRCARRLLGEDVPIAAMKRPSFFRRVFMGG